ncbi:MAG: cellulase family glycosylhydrolase [Sphingobacteriales bacterium]|nr:cellulase family glycosylhydrolase [Sphingobacteriales bacterium]
MSSSAKSEGRPSDTLSYLKHFPWTTESFVDKEAKDYGFNVVRYLIFWNGIEPHRDNFRQAYLDSTERRVRWYTDRGMYVILDMHQDVYSNLLYGNGAPRWATITNGLTPDSIAPLGLWWLRNIQPAVINAYQNFFQHTNHKYLQEHYIMAWQKVIERFKDNPYVIGYDLMNEPHGGDLVKTLFGEFERNQLAPFYNRLIKGIREVDNEKWIFFEPRAFGVNFALESHLPKISDQRIGHPRMQYAPHCYPLFIESKKYIQSDKPQLLEWERRRQIELKLHGSGFHIGEFKYQPEWAGLNEYFSDFFEMTDRNMANWTYWSSDPGGAGPWNRDFTENIIMDNLIRVYPRAIAGEPISFNYNKASNIFNLSYKNNPAISQPTEIFIPNRFFINGYNLVLDGATNYTTSFDVQYNILKIYCSEAKEVKITITAK